MSELLLTAETGRPTGTRSSRRLRAEGKIPGVVYGLGQDPVAVSVEWPALRKALTTEAGVNALLTLSIDGSEQLSIVKDIQRHPTRRDVTHVDFIRLDPDTEIEVEVPIVLEGEALAVTQLSGMVDQSMFSLAIYSRPDAIPTELTVDISELEVGEAIHVSDVALPAGVRTEVEGEETVASALVTRSTLESMREEEEAEAAEGEDAEAGESDGDDGDSDDGDDS
ncbi:MAG: 50S ribosomal protein L25 [Acidimicrobiia bacterium]|nr:50S ribosomal protein L25 [Acidimicrobiia bacterium]